ncbi:MAG: fibronectin type III domain-containing protein [Methanomassiliicoccales archaeon]|nr:fibronectin type III domain-containing protein [Methanomassiliicoccales archaeon]
MRATSCDKEIDMSPRNLLTVSLLIVILLAVPSVHAASDVPTGLQAEVGRDYVDLSWQTVDNASYYLVYRGSGADDMVNIANVTAPITAFHDGDLEDGSSFIYYVTAVNGTDESAPGPSIAATVPAKQSNDFLIPIIAIILSIIAIQVCAVMLLYLFKSKMRLQ